MNRIPYTLLLLAALMSGCGKDAETGTDIGLKEIRLSSGITRSKAVFDGDVAVGNLQFLRKDAAAPTANFSGCTPFVGDRAAGGEITFAQAQYYHAMHNTYIASYYPAGTVSGEGVTWSIDARTDILTADAVDVGSNAVPAESASLAYLHRLAQVEVVCKAAAGSNAQERWGLITGIKLCNTPTKVSCAYNGLKVTANATGNIPLVTPDYAGAFTPIAVPDAANATPNAAGMFFPSTAQTLELEVSTEKEEVRRIIINLGAGHSLEQSKKHIITLTFKADVTQSDISASSTIEEWGNGDSGSGII